MMQQYDGSYHVWFGEKESCLLLSVDDATTTITHGWFAPNEGVQASFLFWQSYMVKHGKPESIYLDKFSTYKINHPNAVDNAEWKTHFQIAMDKLYITLIYANSPQAKGRIERMNQTLQDRLVKELSLAHITTIDAANTFLQTYILLFNQQFGVIAQSPQNRHHPLTSQEQTSLPSILAIHSYRVITNDFTFRFHNSYYQLQKDQPCLVCRKDTVGIEERLDSSIHVYLKRNHVYLHMRKLPEKPLKQKDTKIIALVPNHAVVPASNHPWKQRGMFLPS